MKRKEYTAVNFSNADFLKPIYGFTFTNCSFVDANMRRARIYDCEFIDCDMRGADLSLSTIKDTVFTSSSEYGMDLLGASFVDASIISSKFRKCNMAGVDMRASYVENSEFYGARLKDTKLACAKFVDSVLEDSHYSGERDFVLVHTEWRN